MRKWYVAAGVVAVGAGLVSWATWGAAQTPLTPPLEEVQPLILPKGEPVGKPLPNLAPAPTSTNEPIIVRPLRSTRPTETGTKTAPVKVGGPTGSRPARVNEPLNLPTVETKPAPTEPKKLDPVSPAPVPAAPPSEKAETPAAASNAELSANPTGKQEPSVTLEWLGPAAVKVGSPTDYAITVRNTGATPVQKVVVQVRMASGVNVTATEPKAENAEGVLIWELGTMLPKQEKRLGMKMVTPTKGEMNCQAWVTFTGSSIMKLQAREPKLLVKAEGPANKVMVGDSAIFLLTVSNPGDHTAEDVKIAAFFGEGLESARGNKLNYDLGNLAPGQTRTLQVPCMTKLGGEQKCEVSVEGSDGLKATDAISVSVVQPKLELDVAGPKLRYKDRKAVYTLRVTNPGDAPIGNVFLEDVLPAGMKYLSADSGGQHDFATRTVKWFVGEIAPGQSKEVKIEVMAESIGEQVHKFSAVAARGLKADKEVATTVEGLSAISMEVSDVEDPLEVGAETTYEIKITNTGSKTETDLKLVCNIPAQLEFKSATGPVQHDQIGTDVVFQPLGKLAPRADVVFKLVCKAKVKGDARFKAQLTTTSLVEPVVKVESTRVYED
jgi:uncharacterized repeat protein (TIGR01451 family)